MTTQAIADRFHELALQEKWFDIQDELFDEHVKSLEHADKPYLTDTAGKENVRNKGKQWVSRIQEVHQLSTSVPVVAGHHFAVSRRFDITVEGIGRVDIHEIMLYEVRNGKITKEEFFY